MQSDSIDHEKVSKTECSPGMIEPVGQFKCPNCGRVHAGLAESDVIAHIDEVNRQGPALISTEDYRRCFECRTPSSLFIKADPGDAPFFSTLQSVIAPGTEHRLEQPRFIAGDGTFEIPLYVSYARHRRQAADQVTDRPAEFPQETPQSHPGSCE